MRGMISTGSENIAIGKCHRPGDVLADVDVVDIAGRNDQFAELREAAVIKGNGSVAVIGATEGDNEEIWRSAAVFRGPVSPIAIEGAGVDGGETVVAVGKDEAVHRSHVLAPLRYRAIDGLRGIGVALGSGSAFDPVTAFAGDIRATDVHVVEENVAGGIDQLAIPTIHEMHAANANVLASLDAKEVAARSVIRVGFDQKPFKYDAPIHIDDFDDFET